MTPILENIVTVQALSEVVSNNIAIIDCRFSLMDTEQGRAEYTESHIPGAVYAHLDQDLASPITNTTGRHPLPTPEAFAKCLENWGITTETPVVVYDHNNGAIAARLWWMLRWVDHNNVALLDGGFKAWVAAGYSTQSGLETNRVKTKISIQPDNNKWLTTNAVENRPNNSHLLDARDKDRYDGKTEPIDRVAGHIPGAINASFMQNLNPDGTFLPAKELCQRFESILGDQEDDYSHVIHSCGSGVTACHNLLAMELAGMPGSKLYVGSWSEWVADPSRPIEQNT